MGWGNCGTDSQGRQIGYVFEAVCDEPGCTASIDRGLSYACGDMHGENGYDCEKYFCEEHRWHFVQPDADDKKCVRVCNTCRLSLIENGFIEDMEEGILRPA